MESTQVTEVYSEPRWNVHWQSIEVGRFKGALVLVMPLMYTHAIITVTDPLGYEDRWCYGRDPRIAVAAAQKWLRDGGDEPDGWHRHPKSGRRREQGDPATEHVWH